MKKLIGFQLAFKILITILSLLILFHLSILFGILPGDIVWGSQINDQETLLVMEIISLAVTVLFLASTIIYIKDRTNSLKRKLTRVLLWFMSVYFLLNTIGNLLSESKIESIIFTPVAIILALASLRLAIEKPST